jgi:hypothetical protein
MHPAIEPLEAEAGLAVMLQLLAHFCRPSSLLTGSFLLCRLCF